MTIGTYIPIITLNVNGLNASTKRHRLTEWIQKQNSYISCWYEPTLEGKTHTDWKPGAANWFQNKVRVAILTSDKIEFKIRAIIRDRKDTASWLRDQSKMRYNNYNYTCTQHSSTSIHKANANNHKRVKLE